MGYRFPNILGALVPVASYVIAFLAALGVFVIPRVVNAVRKGLVDGTFIRFVFVEDISIVRAILAVVLGIFNQKRRLRVFWGLNFRLQRRFL